MYHRRRKQFHFGRGRWTCKSSFTWGSLGACHPRKWEILDTLRSFLGKFWKSWMACCNLCHTPTQPPVHCCTLGTKVAAHLVFEGSPVLDSTDVPSSAPKQSMPKVHGLEGSPAFSVNTTYTKGSFTKPNKDVCLINIICSHHVRAQGCSDLHCSIKVLRIYWGALAPCASRFLRLCEQQLPKEQQLTAMWR